MAVALLALFLASACRRNGANVAPLERVGPHTSDAGGKDVAAADARIASAPPLDLRAAARLYGQTLCGPRRRCCVNSISDAGTDGQGRPIRVVTVALSRKHCLQWLPDGGVMPDDQTREQNEDEEVTFLTEPADPCVPYEFHAVYEQEGRVVDRQLLSRACNDGYGAAGAGEDVISVSAARRTFAHRQAGGSAWRGSHTFTIGLDPLRLIEDASDSFHTLNEDAGEASSWNWDDFSGSSSRAVEDCNPSPATPKDGDAGTAPDDDDEGAAVLAVTTVSVPLVSLPSSFVASGWRTTGLGGCAARVNSADHVAHGDKGAADDARLNVVIGRDHTLFVEVQDDRWSDPGGSWVREDHLEFWLGTRTSEGCPRDAEGLFQWGVRVSDGQVFAGFGKPRADGLTVERVIIGQTARFKVRFVHPAFAAEQDLSIVYSDSDERRRQERLIATSDVQFARPETLGRARDIPAAQAVCVVADGALRPHVVRPRPPRHRSMAH